MRFGFGLIVLGFVSLDLKFGCFTVGLLFDFSYLLSLCSVCVFLVLVFLFDSSLGFWLVFRGGFLVLVWVWFLVWDLAGCVVFGLLLFFVCFLGLVGFSVVKTIWSLVVLWVFGVWYEFFFGLDVGL